MVIVQNHPLKARSENPAFPYLTFACLQMKGEGLEAVMRRKRRGLPSSTSPVISSGKIKVYVTVTWDALVGCV